MQTLLIIKLVLSLWLMQPNAIAPPQQQDAQQRAREIAASFDKTKHKIKERHGVRKEKFMEIRSEPAVKADARDYSGAYEADAEYPLVIRVGADNRVEGEGFEPAPAQSRRKFTLRDARIEGALLVGTKVYTDGTTERFEGVFINRTERNSPTESGTTTFGLGIRFEPPKAGDGFVLSRLFYQRKP